ncbi:LysM peptidoglycan-binding domain-containing M23 family metallopeptidase [Oceanibaculum pacificum]|uniref:LysM peptidoglycan-binding domain-containing M23 family metallopeptidase n=1 Tax=Oceanibaculum pacificum TaxID=580166 RepID=UPI0012ED2073|nr:LysM peptidoglycan-binding domain-containing M23 family metallopeptidase [Oceanibaculum pacificum]
MSVFRPSAALVLLVALALAGCARSGPPAPVVYGGTTPSRIPPSVNQPAQQAGGPGMVVIKRGDTLYSIARANDVPLRELIQANNLNPPYVLRVGEALRLPNQRFHAVAAGDTLFSIARRYDVEVSSLARTNNLTPPFTIRVGQRLVLPGQVATIAQAPTVPLANPPAVAQPTPPPTTTTPSRLPGAPLADNPAAGDGGSYLGDTPGDGAPRILTPSTPQAATRPSDAEPAPQASPQASSPQAQAQPAPPPAQPAPEPRVSGSAAIATQPPPRSSDTFLMPVNGRVISRYGPKAGGLHNDGMNIAAPKGSPVLAAENGVVVYAGSELRGFGNLLLINHAGGWMTAYAHNEALLVKRGDVVRRGQAIARVGSTGSVETPQLHFEIRRNSRPVDPQPYLRNAGQAALPQ